MRASSQDVLHQHALKFLEWERCDDMDLKWNVKSHQERWVQWVNKKKKAQKTWIKFDVELQKHRYPQKKSNKDIASKHPPAGCKSLRAMGGGHKGPSSHICLHPCSPPNSTSFSMMLLHHSSTHQIAFQIRWISLFRFLSSCLLRVFLSFFLLSQKQQGTIPTCMQSTAILWSLTLFSSSLKIPPPCTGLITKLKEIRKNKTPNTISSSRFCSLPPLLQPWNCKIFLPPQICKLKFLVPCLLPLFSSLLFPSLSLWFSSLLPDTHY